MSLPTDSAFPWECHGTLDQGIDVRTYLAAKALEGLLASGVLGQHNHDRPDNAPLGKRADGIISASVQFADALLAELNKGKQESTAEPRIILSAIRGFLMQIERSPVMDGRLRAEASGFLNDIAKIEKP